MHTPPTLYFVEITEDHARDAREDDTLTDTELAAWLVGDWRYVSVTVAAYVAGNPYDQGAAELVDIKLGESLDWTFDLDELSVYVADLIDDGLCDLVTPRPPRAGYQRSALAA